MSTTEVEEVYERDEEGRVVKEIMTERGPRGSRRVVKTFEYDDAGFEVRVLTVESE